MLLTRAEVKSLFAPKPRKYMGHPAQPKVGDDSIGWKSCRAVEQSTKRLARTPLMRQVIHQGAAKRKPGVPPAHLRSIDFGSLAQPGKPTKAAKEHFKALIKIKKGIWNETSR